MNYLWAGMIIVGVAYGAIMGTLTEVTNGALDSAKDAITLCITMTGIMAFWMGLMEIATKAGIIGSLTKRMQPLISWLFPNIPKEHKAREYISTNMIANFLGLGWAATPAGLKAMDELGKLNQKSKVASNEMCTFLVINISSLQLIPINIIAYRNEYGSIDPAAITGMAVVATAISTLVGVIFCKCMADRRGK